MGLSAVPVPDILTFIRGQVADVVGTNVVFKDHYYRAIDDFESGSNPYELPLMLKLKRYPVSVEEFMFDPSFLARPRNEIYPAVVEELTRINNPGGYRLTNPYTEVVLTGGIGSAKTTTALYTVAYQLYLLSCFKDPHRTFKMDSTSEILFVFQSLSGGLAKSVDYQRFREICEQSSYFRTVFPFDRNLKSVLNFPGRIEARAIGSDIGSIGQNVIGGIIDELNSMQIITGSKRSIDHGIYNQAHVIYNGLARRRKSRFMDSGRMPGVLCLVSSKRYPGEFTDKKIEEAKKDPTIYIYDKRVWDVKPQGTYNRGWFDVFVGDLTRKARILSPDEEIAANDDHLVVSVPVDFRTDFEDDIIGALRDIAGVGTLARYPFLLNVNKVYFCFGKAVNVFSLEETDFITTILQLRLVVLSDLESPRWAHIDLGVTNDSCGLALGYVKSFVTRQRLVEGVLESEQMPLIHFDGVLRIRPPKGDEILFFKVRDILYLLRSNGLNIKWVSFDSYQSVDSIQQLKQQGFVAGVQSIDTSTNPYEVMKTALYDGRLEIPAHRHGLTELLSLERDNKTGKIDHPSGGSKDVSDAMAGVVYGLTMRREIWAMFGVNPQTYMNRVDNKQVIASDGNPQQATS